MKKLSVWVLFGVLAIGSVVLNNTPQSSRNKPQNESASGVFD